METLLPRRILPRILPKPNTLSQKNGLRYERAFGKQLQKLSSALGAELEHNPWFEFRDDEEELCVAVPDFVLKLGYNLIVFECKLTYVPEAAEKLNGTYVPLLRSFSPRTIVRPLIVCKSMTLESRHVPTVERLSELFSRNFEFVPVLHWLGRGNVIW